MPSHYHTAKQARNLLRTHCYMTLRMLDNDRVANRPPSKDTIGALVDLGTLLCPLLESKIAHERGLCIFLQWEFSNGPTLANVNKLFKQYDDDQDQILDRYATENYIA